MCHWSFQQPGLLIGSQSSFPLVKHLQTASFTASESASSEASVNRRAVCGQFPCRCCKRHKHPQCWKNATCILDCKRSHAMAYVPLFCLLHSSFQAPGGKMGNTWAEGHPRVPLKLKMGLWWPATSEGKPVVQWQTPPAAAPWWCWHSSAGQFVYRLGPGNSFLVQNPS